MRHSNLQDDEHDAETRVEHDGSESARAAEALDPGVPQSLDRENRDTDTEGQQDSRATVKQPHSAEDEHRRWRQGEAVMKEEFSLEELLAAQAVVEADTSENVQQSRSALQAEGLVKHNGRYRNGKPVWVLTAKGHAVLEFLREQEERG